MKIQMQYFDKDSLFFRGFLIFVAMKPQNIGEHTPVGILGGGQLGKMLIQAASDLNIHMHCLDEDPNAPCAALAHSYTIGSIRDFDTVLNFGRSKKIVTVEIENVNIEALELLEKEGVLVYPQPAVLRLIKDKGIQKSFYTQQNIPNAPFHLYENKQEILNAGIKLPFVQKLCTGGYDGKGVQVINTIEDYSKLFDAPSIVEDKIEFSKEISIIVSRNAKGETSTFPAVECEFNPQANLVEFQFSPAAISPAVEKEAALIATKIITEMNMVGLLAVEFFLDHEERLMVNEMAPRPHNSGHHTIECCETSQFAQHLRAILNLPLGNTSLRCPGAMLNLLGEPGFEGAVYYDGLEEVLTHKGTFVHLYGKEHTKPFRKMGHITLIGATVEEVKERSSQVKGMLKVIAR